jgi:hypothetical protein
MEDCHEVSGGRVKAVDAVSDWSGTAAYLKLKEML